MPSGPRSVSAANADGAGGGARPPATSSGERALGAALAAPAIFVLAFFFLLPLGAVAFDATQPGAFARVFASPIFWRSLGGSAVLTLVAAGVSTAVGFAVALHLSRVSARRRAAMTFLVTVPLTFSGLIVAYGFILAYGRAGFVTQSLATLGLDPAALSQFLYSALGLAFASSYYLVPRVVMLLLPVLLNFERAQLLAAESLGAGPRRALAEILVPQILPAVATSFCLVAAVVFGAYGTALALVGTRVNILPLQLYSMISETGSDAPAAAALALLLAAICSGFLALGESFAAARERRA
jgi:putative spermidine/putrescine transport system permease protein